MAGSASAAERLRAGLLRHVLVNGTSFVIVAETASEPLGFAELSHGTDIPPFPVVARAGINAMGLLGALGAAWRSRARLRVELPAPEGGVHLVELQVSPAHRNRGVGAFLLSRVDDHAIEQNAAHISLTTTTDNPARRLYERNGYRVVGQKTNARYERITGSEGRLLMVKPVGTP
jgi:ribosomal protein S18 acetylase RimI-like enzyme